MVIFLFLWVKKNQFVCNWISLPPICSTLLLTSFPRVSFPLNFHNILLTHWKESYKVLRLEGNHFLSLLSGEIFLTKDYFFLWTFSLLSSRIPIIMLLLSVPPLRPPHGFYIKLYRIALSLSPTFSITFKLQGI